MENENSISIPTYFKDCYLCEAGKTLSINGFSSKDTLNLKFGNTKIKQVFRIKGKLQEGSFLVLYDPNENCWYKLAGSPRSNTKINTQEYTGITESLKLNGENNLVPKVKLDTAIVTSQEVAALKTPHFGPSIDFLRRESRGDKAVLDWLFDVYTIAFLHALKLFETTSIWTDDPNPGNILLRLRNASNANVMLIDFTSRKFQKEVTSKNCKILENKFSKHANRIRKQ